MGEQKNIYEVLNDIEFNIEDYEKEDLNDLEKENLKKNFRKSKKKQYNFKKIGAIVATLVLTIGILSQTNFSKSVYATAQSKISEISYSISKALGIERNIEPYANVVNQVIESNGIEMKLTDVIIDKDELILSAIVDTGEYLRMPKFDIQLFINGKRMDSYSGRGASSPINESETILSLVDRRNIKDINLTENLDIKIIYDNLSYYDGKNEKEISGKWEFEFTANGSELTENTYAVPLAYSFNIGNEKYTLEEFRYNPINQNIYGKVEADNTGRLKYDTKLKGEDNLRNSIEFYLGTRSGESIIYRYDEYSEEQPIELSTEATSITLSPYIKESPETDGKLNQEEWEQIGDEFTIFLDK